MKGITEEKLMKFLEEHDFDDALTTDHALRALLEELDPWHPIETAPKDSRILLFMNGYKYIGKWNDNHQYWMDDEGFRYTMQPTHWKKLPEDPKD